MSVKKKGKLNLASVRVELGVREGLILSGDLIAQRAQGKAHVVSGRWKRSIKRGNPYRTTKGMAISIGSNVEYAMIEETRLGEKHGTPHAALRPAIAESKRDAIMLIARRVLSRLVKL